LDAALHAIALGGFLPPDRPHLPFAFGEVALHAAGATSVRVAVRTAGNDAITVALADQNGRPVAEVGALTLRPFSAEQLNGGA
ncbi:polyketide synthase dehydratase domain-containing protein, partial [Streptomyces sp. DT224]|uniref:polyketide synthase dehydratase domain-containing protein n=1 Tax=Streptomyces sp. DT224 TaxID=3393426 RepID=UPI003CEFB691